MAQKVTSTDIKLALKEFHNGKPSYFITECKTCSTYFPDPQGLLKFDGLAITKSYTKPNIKEQSLAMRKEDYAIAVSFGDPKEYYLIEDNLMEDLYKSREALRAVIDALGGLDDRLVDLDNLTGNGIRALIRRHLE